MHSNAKNCSYFRLKINNLRTRQLPNEDKLTVNYANVSQLGQVEKPRLTQNTT